MEPYYKPAQVGGRGSVSAIPQHTDGATGGPLGTALVNFLRSATVTLLEAYYRLKTILKTLL